MRADKYMRLTRCCSLSVLRGCRLVQFVCVLMMLSASLFFFLYVSSCYRFYLFFLILLYVFLYVCRIEFPKYIVCSNLRQTLKTWTFMCVVYYKYHNNT